MSLVKKTVRRMIPSRIRPFVVHLVRILEGKRSYSFLDEEAIIRKHLRNLPLRNDYCVDIAAGDGIGRSNTYALFRAGWEGIAVEFGSNDFAKLADSYRNFQKVNLVRAKVIPDNVVSILRSCLCPKEFSFLSLDIDGYDYFVLERTLEDFRPRLICVEINEIIPPPIQFTVLFDGNYEWASDHFFGQSICKCYELCKKHDYNIVELHYNNLFVVPKEISKDDALSPEKAYELGYKNRIDRKEKFPWNADVEALLNMEPEGAIQLLRDKFQKYDGKFILE